MTKMGLHMAISLPEPMVQKIRSVVKEWLLAEGRPLVLAA